MEEKFITNTSSIKTTHANVRKIDAKVIDAKNIKINGEDILDKIKENKTIIKHAQDTRETVTENDLWGQWVETLEDGTVIIHDDWITNPNSPSAWDASITKVEDNKGYVDDTLYGNIQTQMIKDGTRMFYNTNLTSFSSDLSSLQDGISMFYWCDKLTRFSTDLPSLTDGKNMFDGCSKLTRFSTDLPSLTDGDSMFSGCSKLTSFSSDLSSLTYGYEMFDNCFNLATFSSDLSSLTDGSYMFRGCDKLTTFSTDLPSLANGYNMFYNCFQLTTFSSNLSSLTNGYWMFNNCSKLTTFSTDLPSLTYGSSMFYNCKNLTSFSSDLSSLQNGEHMFYYCSKLTSFSSDLPSLTNGNRMFNNCSSLTSFSSDLSSLTYGSNMFNNCSNLATFSSDLSSLTSGENMFNKCKLNAQSVMYIIHSIKDIAAEKQLYTSGTIPYMTKSDGVYSAPRGFMSDGSYVYTYKSPKFTFATFSASLVGQLTIGIDVTNDSSTIEQQLQTFAEGTLFDSWADLKQAFVDKGWTVTWQYGGSDTSITYDIRDGERIIPCPVYTRLIEILPQEGEELTEEEKNMATYCNEDGTKFYNIEWGHDVTHPEEFQQFDSLETACASYGIMPKEYLETNGQTTLF